MSCPVCGKGEIDSIIRSLRFEENGQWIVTWKCPNNRHQQGLTTPQVIVALGGVTKPNRGY